MYQSALLLLTGSIRLVIESIGQYLNTANKRVVKRLYVKLEPEFSKPLSKSDLKALSSLSFAVPVVYNKASSVCKNLDVRVLGASLQNPNRDKFYNLNFDVILTNSVEEEKLIRDYVTDLFSHTPCSVVKLDNVCLPTNDCNMLSDFSAYKTVCLGGTFDRLHNGHKVLLSEAVLRAREKLIVGVSDIQMIKKKVLWELIEPIEKRMEEVSKFLFEIDPSLVYDVVPISDPFGPTIVDPDIDCIVVTTETKAGGEKVNIERTKKEMPALDVVVVDVVENSERSSHEEEKISSSTNRMHLLGMPQKVFQISPSSEKPYCILFRGNFMSGKSFIANRFQLLGLPVLCCDEIMKAIFNKDVEVRSEVRERIFQNSESADSFDFEKLAIQCLRDKKHKVWLSELILSKMKTSLQQVLKVYSDQGARVVLVKDSAILEGCDLEVDIHEIWASIVPINEALKKLKEVYNLTDEDASGIVQCLPPNEEYVATANILFCNMWSTDAIQAQVDRAWSYVNSIKESMLPNML